LSAQFAQCLGLQQRQQGSYSKQMNATNKQHNNDLHRNSVNVRFLPSDSVDLALTVEVIPLSTDDWEILELQPRYLEEQILNQISVLYEGQGFNLTFVHEGSFFSHNRELYSVPSVDSKTDTHILASRLHQQRERFLLGVNPDIIHLTSD